MATRDPYEIVETLRSFRPRLADNSFQALVLYEAWSALNTPSSAREALVRSPVTKAIGVMWQATQDSLIICLTRAFDKPGRSLHGSDRVSFVVFRHLLDEPSVLDTLMSDAQSKVGPDMKVDAGQAVINAAARLRDRLDSLAHEQPNRLHRLRAIRDHYLAHQLQLGDSIPPPIFQNLRTMVDEVLTLAEDATRVLQPTLIEWPRGEVEGHTARLIDVVAEKFPHI